MKNFQSENIYVRNFLRREETQLDSTHSKLVSRLAAIEGSMTIREDSRSYTQDLLSAFVGIPEFEKIDRICLVRRVPLANELQIVDFTQTDRLEPNDMTIGYRCFVRSESSLFRLKEGEVRSYHDVDSVLESFSRDEEPVQRSLAKIARQGCKSGFCLPLHFRGDSVGFQFFNSSEKGVFEKVSPQQAVVFSLIAALSKTALFYEDGMNPYLKELKNGSLARFSSQAFDGEEFSSYLGELTRFFMNERWTLRIEEDDTAPFLYVPSIWGVFVLRVMRDLFGGVDHFPRRAKVEAHASGRTALTLNTAGPRALPLEAEERVARSIERDYKFMGCEIEVGPSKVRVLLPRDEVFWDKDDVRYSVDLQGPSVAASF